MKSKSKWLDVPEGNFQICLVKTELFPANALGNQRIVRTAALRLRHSRPIEIEAKLNAVDMADPGHFRLWLLNLGPYSYRGNSKQLCRLWNDLFELSPLTRLP